MSLLTNVYATWLLSTNHNYHWPAFEHNLGQPLGPATFESPFIRRDFEYGSVEIEMTSGRYPNPFDYRIWVLGHLVSELAIPFHTP